MVDYGYDLTCTTDLDPNLSEVSGLTCLAQALVRRLITGRGTLVGDPNYGYDIREFLNDDMSPADVGRVEAGIDAELLKDERVVSSSSTVTLTAGAVGVMTIAIKVTPSGGPTFNLVLAVTQVTVTILAVNTST